MLNKLKTKIGIIFSVVAIMTVCGAFFMSATVNAEYVSDGYLTLDSETGTIIRCDNMSGDIVIPDNIDGVPVTAIGDNAFKFCEELTSVSLPESVTLIGEYAFERCSNLESVTLTDNVTSIGEYAFYGCSNLVDINIPENISYIGKGAFEDCYNLTTNINVIRGRIRVPDSIDIPETGLEIEISLAARRPYSRGGGIMGYPGSEYYVPPNTNWLTENGFNYTLATQTITVYSAETIVPFFVKHIPDNRWSMHYSSYCAAYKIKDPKFIGSGGQIIEGSYFNSPIDEDVSFTVDITEKSFINGTIIVPKSDSDIGLTVVAEGNRQMEETEYGDYNVTRDFAVSEHLEIPAGDSSIEYSLGVLPDMDYDIYLVFDDKQFCRQEQFVHVSGGEKVKLDFDNFVKSKTVHGNLAIPCDAAAKGGNTLDEIRGYVTLQSAEPPYYILDTYEFSAMAGDRNIPFTLYDNIGVGNAIVYYNIYSPGEDIANLYCEGYYNAEMSSAFSLNNATHFTPDDRSISMTVSRTKKVCVNVANIQGKKYLNSGGFSVSVILQNGDDEYATGSEAPAVVRRYGSDAESSPTDDTYELYNSRFDMNVPIQFRYYILSFGFYNSDDEYIELYYSDNGLVSDINKAVLFEIKDNSDENINWQGYDEPLPFDVYVNNYYDDSTENYVYGFDIYNNSDFAKDKTHKFLIFFDENNIDCKSDLEIISVNSNDSYSSEAIIRKSDYESAKSIYLFLWDENLTPLCFPTPIK